MDFPMMPPKVRQGTGQSRYVCPVCGSVAYRTGTFTEVPEDRRVYKGQEERAPEICGAVPGDITTPGLSSAPIPVYLGLCRGIMEWRPQSSATDLLREDFIVDLGDGPKRVSSLSEIRALERDSEQRHRNGEGAIHVFRDLSQNQSNRGDNTLSGSAYEKGKSFKPPSRITRSGLPISVRAISSKD